MGKKSMRVVQLINMDKQKTKKKNRRLRSALLRYKNYSEKSFKNTNFEYR